MKTTKRFAFLLPALGFILLLAACTKEESTLPEGESKLVALTVATPHISESDETTEITRSGSEEPAAQTVTVPAGGGMTLEATLERTNTPATRGTTALTTGVKYRIIAFAQDNVTTAGYKSYADFAVGTTGSVAGDLNVLAGSTYTFVCYSLNKTTLPTFDSNSLDITADPATDDLLYAKFNQTITEASKTLSFSFLHKFSQVTVIADATNLAQNITAISATLSPNYSATLAIANGALTAGTSAARTIPWGTITAAQTVTATACTVFTNGSSSVSMSIPSVTIDGTTKTSLTATFGTNSMQAGYKYTLRLKFKALGIEVSGINVYWAKGNVRSLDSGATFSFYPNQYDYSGVWNGGDYFCWNTLNPSSLTSSNSTATYNSATDPCTKVAPAGTWRMPTEAELTALIASSVWGTYGGNNGRFFGTTTVPAEADKSKYVFLPAAGYRDSTTLYFVGTGRSYWSATPSGTTYAYTLTFYITYAVTGGSNRNFGVTVRCVSDK